MSEPMPLFDMPPIVTLTDRQTVALAAITTAGYDGLHTDELGAHVHAWQGKHPADETCEWCSSVAMELGRRLRDLQLVKQRRVKAPAGDTYMVWVDVAAKPTRVVRDYDFPAGF